MKKVKRVLVSFLIFVMGMSLSACTSNGTSVQKGETSPGNEHIKSITAITEVFGDGQKITAVAMEYDKDIDNSKLTQSAFSVSDMTITKVYANNAAEKASQGTNGKYVIIELSANASTSGPNMGGTPPNDQSAGGPPAGGPPTGGAPAKAELKASVTQAEDIVTTDGTKYTANSNEIVNDKIINLVVDDFKQLEFKDPTTGDTLKYNLYIPKNYDKNKSYPMVMFIHDSSVVSTETTATLTQGNGAVIWATPSEQAKHECFVLAPQYSTTTANDNSETTKDLDDTVDLISSLESQYSIDKNRLYATGQSMGGMSSIALNIKYPDLFAASMLVACQWDTTKVAPLAKDKLWIIVSEGDEKAFPGMNDITSTLEKDGAKISRATWNGRADAAEFASDVSKMKSEGSNINYTVLKKGTVVSEGQEDNAINNHMSTWKVAYNIEGVRDWLFAQSK